MLEKGMPVDWLLRVGLAFALLYPPVAAYFDPNSWIGYFPPFLRGIAPDITILTVFGTVEVALAVWIISGWRVHIPATIAAILLLAIVLYNPAQFPVLFRDISIAAMAIALTLSHWPHASDS